MKLDKLGWVVAAGMAGALAVTGFQGSSAKFATVDLAKVFDGADETKSGSAEMQSYLRSHFDVINFIKVHPEMLPTDAKDYAEIDVKANKTPAETDKLKQITQHAEEAASNNRLIAQKQNPSPDEIKQMQDYSGRRQQNGDLLQQLSQQYQTEADTKRQELHDKSMEKIRRAVGELAKKDGYTVVFTIDSAPYAANDITEAALKSVKKE